MAKERPRCVICGQETEFFRRATLPLYNTNQIVCTECRQRYESASGQERDRLKEQMLSSPYLWDRERLEQLMSWKRAEESRSAHKEHSSVLEDARREQALQCCGQKMTCQGLTWFSVSENPALPGERRSMSVYRCGICGQYKFFQPLEEGN